MNSGASSNDLVRLAILVHSASPSWPLRIELSITSGAGALAVYAPADQPSASFEPTTCELSAMAHGEGGPLGMPALASGGRLALRATLRRVDG